MGFLLSPAFSAVSRFATIAPLEEYRKLAEWPKAGDYFGEEKLGLLEYTKQLNTWFSDNFATRPFWVRTYTQILYSVFRESDQVHIGPGDWLFYRTVIDRETPALDRIPPKVREQMISRMAKLSELLYARGITLFVVPVALKHAYYPEFLPPSAEHAKHFQFFDAYMDESLALGGVNIIDSRPILKQAKEDGLKIFHQTDFHWTDVAGGLVAMAIIDAIGIQSGQLNIAANFSFKIITLDTLMGGQSRALPLFQSPTEVSIGVKPLTPATTFTYKNGEDGIETQGEATSNVSNLFDPILVYGDSFFDAATRAGFFNNFKSFARARIWQNDIVNAYQNRPLGTRFMVIEYITSATAGVDNHVSALITHLETERQDETPSK